MAATHYMWEEFRGPVAPGYALHHICGKRNCVRPAHLELVPHAEHLIHHARKRRVRFSPEEWDKRRKARQRANAKKEYLKMKAKGLRRAKRRMPDGTDIDGWVPLTAGKSAVYDHLFQRWLRKNGTEDVP